MKLKCAIVDDEPLALGLLESYVEKTPFLELTGKYSSAVQAMKELPEKQTDLLFLDIQMPELNGLEFSKMVDSRTRIIFTTAFEQYAPGWLQGKRTGLSAQAYLLYRLSPGCQQGRTLVRTPQPTPRRNHFHLRQKRL